MKTEDLEKTVIGPLLGGGVVLIVSLIQNGFNFDGVSWGAVLGVAFLAEGVYMMVAKTLFSKILTAGLLGAAIWATTGTQTFGLVVGVVVILALMFLRFFQAEAPKEAPKHAQQAAPQPAGDSGVTFTAKVSPSGGGSGLPTWEELTKLAHDDDARVAQKAKAILDRRLTGLGHQMGIQFDAPEAAPEMPFEQWKPPRVHKRVASNPIMTILRQLLGGGERRK